MVMVHAAIRFVRTARQLGFEDGSECPQLCKLAVDYLKRTEGCEGSIYEYFAGEPDSESLRDKLLNELERCILAYFSFHWDQATVIINQVTRYRDPNQTKHRRKPGRFIFGSEKVRGMYAPSNPKIKTNF